MNRMMLSYLIAYMFVMMMQVIAEDVKITRGPVNTTSCAHQNASMFCGFTGADPEYLVLNWSIILRNGVNVMVYTYSVYEINRDPNNHLEWIPDLNNPNNSKLIVNTSDDRFNRSSFQCIIISGFGNVIKSTIGDLIVAGPPIIFDHDILEMDDEICLNDLTIHWNSFSHLVCGLVEYNITLRYLDNSEVTHFITFDKFHNFTNLQEDTVYSFTIIGSNLAGHGELVTKNVKTSKPNNEPKISRIQSCLNDITVYWDAENSSSCGGVLYYTVTLHHNFDSSNTTNTTDLFHTFTGLQNSTLYTITISSTTRAGTGYISPQILVKTLKPQLGVHLLANSSVSPVNDNDFNISWAAPIIDRCIPPITGYIVVIVSFNGNTHSSTILPATLASILFSEYFSGYPVTSEMEYDVTVIAINNIYKHMPTSNTSAGMHQKCDKNCDSAAVAVGFSLFSITFMILIYVLILTFLCFCHAYKHGKHT